MQQSFLPFLVLVEDFFEKSPQLLPEVKMIPASLGSSSGGPGQQGNHDPSGSMADSSHHSHALMGFKRMYSDLHNNDFQNVLEDMDRPAPKKKGRKKSFIWSHVVTDDQGKVHCRHCGLLIRVNFGEKVSRCGLKNICRVNLCIFSRI